MDKNPLAVEMAKLSLWLLTLAKDKPFKFLDHAIRCGDSLVGVSSDDAVEDLLARRPGDRDHAAELPRHDPQDHGGDPAAAGPTGEDRRRHGGNVEEKERLFANIRFQTKRLNYAADRLLAASWQPAKPTERVGLLRKALQEVDDRIRDVDPDTLEAEGRAHREEVGCPRPFHWALEFPEVFLDRGGFDAFVSGYSPFRPGRYLSSDFGDSYLSHLQTPPFYLQGQADFCSAFCSRGFSLLQKNGSGGFITTKTISEGDTRAAFLSLAMKSGGQLAWVRQLVWWPGDAQVVVSLLVIRKSKSLIRVILDGKEEQAIDATFSPVAELVAEPFNLIDCA